MNLGVRLRSFGIKFFDDFVENCFTGLVAIDFDKKAKGIVMLKNWEGFVMEFFESGVEGFEIFVVGTFTAVVEDLRSVETLFDIGFTDIEDDDGFDFMTTTRSNGHDLIFFTLPAANRGKNERIIKKIVTFEVG